MRPIVLLLLVLTLATAPHQAAAACVQGDVDADGLCDDVDPCRNAQARALREPRLAVWRRASGEVRIQFAGILPLVDDAPADPATTGLRLILREGSTAVLDVAGPPGVAWSPGSGAGWSYRDASVIDGIRRATIREVAPLPAYQAARAYFVSIEARMAESVPLSDVVWHQATLLLDAGASTSRCADQDFRPRQVDPGKEWQLWDGRCRASTGGAMLRCRSGSLRRPCHVSLAVDEMRCLLAEVARGQEAYHALHGTYSSSGLGLLSFPQPAYTVFVTWGTTIEFEAAAAHAAAPGLACRWKSIETPHLTCGPYD